MEKRIVSNGEYFEIMQRLNPEYDPVRQAAFETHMEDTMESSARVALAEEVRTGEHADG